MSIIVFLIVLSILVLVHEFGHFIAAKKQGILVEEFGLGYPPRLISIKKGETVYSLNLIPLGGFVKVYGEEFDEKIKPSLKHRSFSSKKPWQKTIVLIAGVLGNFILGWVILSYLFTQGVPTPTNKVIVEKVIQNSPAGQAKLQAGDVIKKIIINDKKTININDSNQLTIITKKYAGKELTFVIQRKNSEFSKKINPRQNPPAGQGPLGIIITSFIEKKYSWYQAPIFALSEAININKKIAVELIRIIFRLLTFKKIEVQVSGPIGIAYYTGQVIKFGKNALLELMALLSFNLAIINFLPFPALDGGRLMFVFYEWITKKKPPAKFEKYINLIGFIILITFAILISINDIQMLTK